MAWMDEGTRAAANGAARESSTETPTTHLIIVDRRALIRECIASSFRALRRRIAILREASVVEDLKADELALADLLMLCTNTSPAINEPAQREITSLLLKRPELPIVLIADSHDTDEAKHLVSRWRLRGYIPTYSTLAMVEGALDLILAGGTYLPPAGNSHAESSPSGAEWSNTFSAAKLTARERSVLSFLREGMPNKVIAHRLGISQSTVKAHIHSIMTKLHSRNRTEAAVLAGKPLFTQSPGCPAEGLVFDHLGRPGFRSA